MTYEDIIKLIKELPPTQLPGILAETLLTCQDQAVFRNRKAIIDFVVSTINRPLPVKLSEDQKNRLEYISRLKEILKSEHNIIILEDVIQPCQIINGDSYAAKMIDISYYTLEGIAKDISKGCKMFAFHSFDGKFLRAILVP